MIFYDETEERYIRKFFLLLAIYIKLNVRSTLISDRKQKFSNWFVYFGGTPRSIDPRQTQTQQFPLAIRRENSWLPLGRRERQGWNHGSPRGINIQRESTIISRELSLESRIQDSSRHRAVHLWNPVTVQKLQFLIFTLSQLFYFLCVGCSFASTDVGTWKMNWTCVEVHESLRSRSINSTQNKFNE